MIEVKFSLELTKNGVQKCIHAKSGEENSRKAVITLTENGKVFDAAGYYVKVYFDNGKHVDTEDDRKLVTVENGCIGFVIPYDLVAEEGERLCELQISKDNRILYSPVFKVLVEQSLGQHGVSEPAGDVTRYQEVIPDLMPKDDILFDDEIAVYTPEDELTTKRKVLSLPFGKKLENEAEIERIDASDVDEIKQLSNGKYAEAKDVPTKVSQLTNDKNFVDVEKVESMIKVSHENESPIVTSALAMVSMLASETIIASIEAPNEASKITSKFTQAIKQVTVRDVYYSPSATGVLEFRDAFWTREYKIDVTQGKTYRFSSEGTDIVVFEVDSIEEIEILTGVWRDRFGGSSEPNPSLPPINADASNYEAFFVVRDNSFAIETSLLPSNARATKIEIPDLVNKTGDYIQLEDMAAKDPSGIDCPYYIMYPKDMMGSILTNVAAIVVFTISPNVFYNLVASYAYNSTTIKIYYEIEEN